MKLILLIFFILFSKSIFANDEGSSEVEVIDLYESKSLDQMVLENLNVKDETNNDQISDETIETQSDDVEIKQIEVIKNNFFYNNEIKNLENYFENLKKINSKTLQIQINEVFENLELNLEIEKDKQIFFHIVNYFKSIGLINKSYELISKHDLSNDKNFNFYTEVKLNYLLSTFQLNEACNYKEELNSNVTLDFFFLEKIDIFCLVLNDNQSEANLLNSILIESEKNSDIYFQELFSLISNPSDPLNTDSEIKNLEINKELIFLYSAMTRIAELPFSDSFYELDKKNLSIPIILNQASPIDLRIKAANNSFLEKLITVDSLAALYMSADFNSDQFGNPQKTLDSFLDNKELSMAFLFQLVNIQIFPNDRLNALIKFWEFAKQNDLDEIAYKLSINMLSSIDVNSENIIHGPQIASAYIFNNNFKKALEWIELYESANQVDSKSIYTRILLDIYSSNDLNSFINSINLTFENYTDDENNQNTELLFVINDVMNLDIKSDININFENIFDNRSMPSIFILNEITKSINNNNYEKFLFYSLISLNGKEWNDLHPEHLKIILNGYFNYKDGTLFRSLVLEIFKSYKFIL